MKNRRFLTAAARILLAFAPFGASLQLAAAPPASAMSFTSQDTVHITLWALSEAPPGTPEFADPPDNPWTYAARRIRETAPFLIEGMVYGWEFSYTPSDTARSVAEQFSLEPFGTRQQSPRTLSEADIARISYAGPREENNQVSCWVDFALDDTMILLRKQWRSVSYRRITGRGFAPFAGGLDAIKQAAADALKNAVREYARGLEKNKPKEIEGRVVIVNNPSIGINAGKYQIELDFFLEMSKIELYSLY
jgi:hypothetical protein